MSTQKPETIYEERDQLYAKLSRQDNALEKRLNEIRRLEGVKDDLLTALKGLLRVRGLDPYGLNDSVFAAARAAIAKAEEGP